MTVIKWHIDLKAFWYLNTLWFMAPHQMDSKLLSSLLFGMRQKCAHTHMLPARMSGENDNNFRVRYFEPRTNTKFVPLAIEAILWRSHTMHMNTHNVTAQNEAAERKGKFIDEIIFRLFTRYVLRSIYHRNVYVSSVFWAIIFIPIQYSLYT